MGRGEREPAGGGVLVKHGPLHRVATATTVRVRGGETELDARSLLGPRRSPNPRLSGPRSRSAC